MKFGVVVFPGSNCDKDIILALENTINKQVVELWHKDTDLKGCDVIFLPGGFSFGDYLRSGAIAKFSPIMKKIIEFGEKGGYVIGICNGFQILTEIGLLPGALMRNAGLKFICRNLNIRVEANNSIFTEKYQKEIKNFNEESKSAISKLGIRIGAKFFFMPNFFSMFKCLNSI